MRQRFDTPADRMNPLPFSAMSRGMRPPVIVELMTQALANPGLMSLAAGFTDNAILPHESVKATVDELLTEAGRETYLQYGTNQGREPLRALTADHLARMPNEQREVMDPRNILIANGSQQALYIAVQTLCDPGDIILVEDPTYFVCLEMLKGLRVEAIGMACDAAGGILPDRLDAQLEAMKRDGRAERIRAVYLVSYNSNPSSRCMTRGEKVAVAERLIRHELRVPVIEDAAYRELYFETPHPAPSILSLDAFETLPKLYLGTYTKPFATGLKVGYGVCSSAEWMEKMLCIKGHQDFGTNHFTQAVMERILERGRYAEQLSRARAHYAAKAEAMQDALCRSGLHEAGWHWDMPCGGLVFWLRGPEGIDLSMGGTFCAQCIEQGVLYVPGDLCFAAGAPFNCARLATGTLDVERLREAVHRFATVALSG